MKYTIKNVTLNINQEDGDFTGDGNCEIPFTHKKFITDNCGMEKHHQFSATNGEPVFTHNYASIYLNEDQTAYYVDNPDMIIMYLSWLFSQDENFEIDVTYSNPFWAIHDCQHALNDSESCTIYVDENIEKERLEKALELMIKEGYNPSYELIEEIQNAYYSRFGIRIYLEDYLYELEDAV